MNYRIGIGYKKPDESEKSRAKEKPDASVRNVLDILHREWNHTYGWLLVHRGCPYLQSGERKKISTAEMQNNETNPPQFEPDPPSTPSWLLDSTIHSQYNATEPLGDFRQGSRPRGSAIEIRRRAPPTPSASSDGKDLEPSRPRPFAPSYCNNLEPTCQDSPTAVIAGH